MAYLSALLERGQEGCKSKRFTAIKTFFERAVSVVPLESIFHAMANAKPEVALQCCEIFNSCDTFEPTNAPKSLLASMKYAFSRIRVMQLNTVTTPFESSGPARNCTHTMQLVTGKYGVQTAAKLIKTPKKNLGNNNELLNSTQSRIKDLVSYCSKRAGEKGRKVSPSNIDLEVIYPSYNVKDTHQREVKCCKAPMTLLTQGRKELNLLSEELIATHVGRTDEEKFSNTNIKMLEVLTKWRKEFETCSALLGAFMESQVQIPLEKAGDDKYVNKLAKHTKSFGLSVLGLLILPFEFLNRIMSSLSEDFRQFVVEFSSRLDSVRSKIFRSSGHEFPDYDQRLEFLLGSMKKSVACNQRYVSYSLERQVEDQCRKRNIFHDTPVHEILAQWDDNFEGETLALVTNEYRDLVARWIKWSLMINDLRENLASQTAIGVIGLVNSGKSKFVRSLFGKEVSKQLRIFRACVHVHTYLCIFYG